MTKFTTSMPLEDSPWATSGLHDPLDIENYIADYRNRSKRVMALLSAKRQGGENSFLEGSQQSLAPFSVAGRAHGVTGGSTFSFSEMKDDGPPTTVFLIADANAMKAQMPLISLVQWCMIQELRRHPAKHKPVTLLCDEAANFCISGLNNLMTTARGYGLRLHLFLQNFSAFTVTYSKETLDTLLSEAEILQFMPQTRQDAVVDYVFGRLGEESIVVTSHRGQRGHGVDGVDYREESKPLHTRDEIRRCKQSIVFVRNNKPIKTDTPPIAAIHPWRKQVGVDPFHGKPWRLPIKLRYRRNEAVSFGLRFKHFWRRIRGAQKL
ncbi:MAG: TraM recognition domain-containing protein [Pseudomonadota bacterium]